MSERTFVLDSSYRRPLDGRTVIAGSPLRLFRVAPGGVDALRALEAGLPVAATAQPLVERLLDAGAIHPRPVDDATGSCSGELTVVLPAHDASPSYRPGRCRTVVVDDASTEPLRVDGAESLRLDVNGGPGAARNAGLAVVETPFVAFVDSDVDIREDQLLSLLAHLGDPAVALVAPRIVGPVTGGRLERYEAVRSPLDLGPEPARIAAGSRVSFVPAAALVCRVDALRALGGFDVQLRHGEDVDVVWRLADAGWRCRYEPAVTARHRTRTTVSAWFVQRVRYGASAAPLAIRHPGALAPVRMSGWSAATWSAVACGAPLAGAVIGVATTLALVRKLRDVPAAESIRLAGLGHLFAARLIASTMVRAWWPVAVALAVVSRRMRRTVVAVAVALAASDWRTERPELDPLTYVALRRLDDLAYGAGVWIGALRHRTAAPLLPSFAPWPPR